MFAVARYPRATGDCRLREDSILKIYVGSVKSAFHLPHLRTSSASLPQFGRDSPPTPAECLALARATPLASLSGVGV